jgi:hypothetical protein
MLKIVSGWRTPNRDRAVLRQRDPQRPAIFVIDEASRLPEDLQDAPIIDLWRHGDVNFNPLPNVFNQIVRINHDTDNQIIIPVVTRLLTNGHGEQILVMYDATEKLFRIYPALREGGAVLSANRGLNAVEGDHVLFTHGGSFAWRDYMIEGQTSMLLDDETLDIGVVSEEMTEFDFRAV